MRLNRRGQALHGELSTSLDGVPLLPGVRATQPDWLTETEVGYQVQRDGRWFLEVCDVETRRVRPLDPAPANTFYARGGVWAAWGTRGVRSNLHPSLPMAGLWGVGWDGTLGYCRSQQQGTGLVLRAVDGDTHEYAIGTTILSTHIYDAQTACYTHGYKLYTIGLPEPVTVPEQVFQPRLIDLRGEWWVLYHTQDRLLLHPLTTTIGYVVSDAPTTYDPDAIAVGPSTIRVVWSVTQGAGASAFRRVDVDLTARRVQLSEDAPPVALDRPRVTISSYLPQAGRAPLTVTAIRTLSGGPATRLHWMTRRKGDGTFVTVADNPASDPDHHYQFTSPGTYEIAVEVIGPGGSDRTLSQRLVEVT